MRRTETGRGKCCRLSTLPCYTAKLDKCSKAFSLGESLRCEEHEHDCGEDHEVCIQEEKHAGVIKAPLALEAAGGFGHAPHGNHQSENLPVGAVEVFYVREAGKAQAGGKCAEREKDSADERFLPQAEDLEEMMHNPFNVRCLRGAGDCGLLCGDHFYQRSSARSAKNTAGKPTTFAPEIRKDTHLSFPKPPRDTNNRPMAVNHESMKSHSKLLSSECLNSHGWEINHGRGICGQIGIRESSASKTAAMTMEQALVRRLSRCRHLFSVLNHVVLSVSRS